ncbi:MAG: hypothetical protein RR314_01480 [Oscillospiraceae bacterium]
MAEKIMYGALIFIGGWFYFYVCLRQFVFDLTVGFPLIKKFGDAGETVFAPKPARWLNIISTVIWLLICIGIGWASFRFFALYLLIAFWAGALLGVALYINKLGPRTRSNFEAFCRTYYRFMPNDELRTAAYNADLPGMRAALRSLNSDLKFDLKKD